MSEAHQHRETVVELVRCVRDQLNREIEATTGQELLDRIQGHRYASPVLQRLVSRAVRKAEASGTAAGSK
jgi:hypothetical protein